MGVKIKLIEIKVKRVQQKEMPPKEQQKSHHKVRKEATQEFFNKKRSSSATQAFTFNKAPINKADAKKDFVEDKERKERPSKRNAFTAKLYRDDDDLEDMKILGGDQFDSDVDERDASQKPRDAKAAAKKKQGQDFTGQRVAASKIGRLNLSKGSVAMFAISEVHQGQYAIVNHTRNMKGFISLKALPEFNFKVGQLVVASVASVGMAVNEKGHSSKKLQLSVEPAALYRTLQVSKVTPGMMLQAQVESKEEKGWFLDLGFKDQAKGFLKFDDSIKIEIGHLVQVCVVSATSKLVKVSLNTAMCVQSTESTLVTEHTLKAGYLVNAKIAKLFENGVEVSFLGGMTGTVFVDHTARESLAKFKVGEKVQARCISHDVSQKNTTMSLMPHIISLGQAKMIDQGATYEKCKVTKVLYGGSYQVKIPGDAGMVAFLHKSHLPGANKQDEEVDEQNPDVKKKATKLIDELEAGQTIPSKVRVKELNYFDGVAHLTMRSQIVNTVAMDYSALEVGQFVNATIDSVNEPRKTVNLSLNEFVKGTLKLDHMADYPLKVVPPKFTQTGKQIKVRIFAIDERQVIFTKKDSLMKHDVPIHKTQKAVKKGDKVVGVIVAQNEHGFIVKSFGDVKGLLTFSDVKDNQSKKEKGDLKAGSAIKCYVLFNKRNSGLALTLDKKKARAEKTADEESKSLGEYMPTEEEMEVIKQLYSSQVKYSSDQVGKTMTWKVAETKSNYYVLKSVLEKKTKIAILPKPMASVFGLSMPFDQDDFTVEGFIYQELNKVPVVTLNPLVSKHNTLIPQKQSELQPGKPYLGLVESISSTLGLQIKFPHFSTHIAIKDMQHTANLQECYSVGAPMITAHNKAGRLSCKDIVLQNVLGQETMNQNRSAMLNAFAKMHALSSCGFKVGQKVETEVQLVKDYGLIVKVDDIYTGFVVNEQKASSKAYKVGQKISCVVLDVDYDKKIIDLSEKLASKPSASQKPTVELTKDSYMIASMNASGKLQLGVCLLQASMNDHNISSAYNNDHRVGQELDAKLVPNTNEVKSELQLLTPKSFAKAAQSNGAVKGQVEMKEGASVNGVLKSIKGHCMFVQVGHQGKVPQIGRLNRIESQANDFTTTKVGDRLNVKVLKVTQDNDRQMIELTRRQEHLELPSGKLNEQLMSLHSLETLKEGQKIQALITDVTPEASSPVQIQISPFVHGQLLFSDVVTADQLKQSSVAKILSKYKEGQQITVYHKQGGFSSQLNDPSQKQLKRGDLCVARYVKVQAGYGITVQMSKHQFGLIELCELTDELHGCIVKHMKSKNLFVARVIDTDKKGRLMLSARESVIENWQTITAGATAAFQQLDSKAQKQGNLKNKILKFGAKLAITANDLFVGNVTNISKAGCFIQIGHNVSIRVGLNELDDSEEFDFAKQMPIGRQVVGRITKCIDNGGEMRFNATLRKSLVVHGVGLLNRNQLKQGDSHTVFVLAVAADVVFGQLNGSYLKIKVKGCPQKTKVGQLVQVKLTKTEPENIKGDFQQMVSQPKDTDETPRVVFESVTEEARQDIQAAQAHTEEQSHQEIDMEQVVAKKRQTSAVEQQIKDLETIAQIEDESSGSDDDMDGEDDEEEMEDSDAEDMARIQSKNYDDSDADMESAEDDDQESGEDSNDDDDEDSEAEDVDMNSDSDSGSEKVEKLKGKKALRAQITQEKEIRQKEQQMRSAKGANPQSVNDFERLLVADQDQSYLWIQYIAFCLDKQGTDQARKVAERAVKAIGHTAIADKLNLWIAYINLENSFGTQESLSEVVKRALEVNDSKKVYLQLVNIYRGSDKNDLIEPIFKKLCKKYFESLEIWSAYVEFLFDMKDQEGCTQPKTILQKSLQALPQHLHINMISKFGMLEYKSGQAEAGRTMFEGIVSNYPKRMDIWSIYMDMEVKYGGAKNSHQARHLFERCLSLPEIQKKPRSMKLVFRKYMEFESAQGTKQKVDALRQRVEEYLEKAFKEQNSDSDSSDSAQ